jgi:hypothetical protein
VVEKTIIAKARGHKGEGKFPGNLGLKIMISYDCIT